MRLPILRSIEDVRDYQLCTGCGACAYLAPHTIEMRDSADQGRRPVRIGEDSVRAQDAFNACPGSHLKHHFNEKDPSLDHSLRSGWGPVRDVFEGYAADPHIRMAGSSGGAITALCAFALEQAQMHGVLHTAARHDVPFLNTTVMSRTRAELIARTGSRYAPASPCEGLDKIESSTGPCVFVGKPCDVAGAVAASQLRPDLAKHLGLTIAFFCAGTPSTEGTLALMRKMGINDPSKVSSLRYRGNGWPGRWTVRWDDESQHEQVASLSYDDSWGFLQKHRQWRCYICPDHTGEFADISVGDPWHQAPKESEPGRSLIVARTLKGREFIRKAEQAGYLVLESRDARLLPRSQPNLLITRGRLWGQIFSLWLARTPRPYYAGFPTFRFWLSSLTLRAKSESIWGTIRRVTRRRLRVRTPLTTS